MGRWRAHVETWLTAEQDDRDAAADSALQEVFSALPGLEPSPAFVPQVVEAAWASALRRRRVLGVTAAAAALLLVAGSAVVLYTTLGGRTAALLTTAAALASGSVVSVLGAGVTLVGWWSAAVDTGAAVARAMASPYSVAVLAAMELVAVAALVMLHRLLRSDGELRAPRAYCF